MLKNRKIQIPLIIVIIIIAIGIGMFIKKGFNYDLYYAANTELDIMMETKNLSIEEIKETVNLIFRKNNIQINDENVSIIIKDVTEEQKTELVNKLNEKYSLSLTKEDIMESKNAEVKKSDIVNPYISPVVISILVILIYFAIRFRKKEWLKKVGITLASLILIQLFAISIIIITRLPLGNLTMPLLLTVYILNILIVTYIFEK